MQVVVCTGIHVPDHTHESTQLVWETLHPGPVLPQ